MSKQNDNLAQSAEKFMKWENDNKINWCNSCGNYAVHNAMKRAFALEGLGIKDVLMCFDVGCCGNGSDKIEGYTMHGLHGRVIPLAAGAAISNPKMKVVAIAGDGGTFSEGVNHLIHGVRNDYPIVFLMHNNENYGLTTGQASATTRCKTKMNGAPEGVVVPPLNACDLVLSCSPSFVARTFSGDVEQMAEIMRVALNHDGFSFIEILQTCPTYNRVTPEEWYEERVKPVTDHDVTDLWAARKICQDMDVNVATGILYRDEKRKGFMNVQTNRQGVKTSLVEEVKHYDIGKFL